MSDDKDRDTGDKKDDRGTWWRDKNDGYGWSSGDKNEDGSYSYHEHHIDKDDHHTVKGWDWNPKDKE